MGRNHPRAPNSLEDLTAVGAVPVLNTVNGGELHGVRLLNLPPKYALVAQMD